ncbi:MAG TPA: N-acetylmuramoyl-L-alanine amidase, partial [Hanamia sp.]|nr:N-acetylmuramoyl-L-alanine amidase [Hanamia sp.]
EQDQLLGSTLINELKKSYKTEDNIVERNNGVWVLDHNVCPAALVECGFLSNPGDLSFIRKNADQEKIAENVLDAINVYASSKENSDSKSAILIDNNPLNTAVIKDTVPSMHYKGKKIKGFTFNDSKNEVYVKYVDGSKETITEEEALKRGIILPPPPNALIFINGKISSKDEMKKIPSGNIQSINVLKGETAIKKYGEKGKNGVIEITTKNDEGFTVTADTVYIGGRYSSKPISGNEKFTGNSKFIGKAFYINSKFPEGTLILADGKEITEDEMKNIPPTNIQSINILKGETAIKKYGEKAKEGAVEITTKNNEHNKKVTQTYLKFAQNDTVPGKVFTKVENEASFPGGQTAWQKYIVKKIQASLDSFTEADYGTCVLKFIVNTDGSVSNVEATTMEGTQLARVSINAIKDGPKWIPASQNGHTVASYRLQPVTLTNPADHSQKNENAFTKIQHPASFPGGESAWLKYISRVIQKMVTN